MFNPQKKLEETKEFTFLKALADYFSICHPSSEDYQDLAYKLTGREETRILGNLLYADQPVHAPDLYIPSSWC